ncbi:MAG: hypothetical protein ACI9G9_000075 [Psychromonas sp.]|jgi:hypothetical protein
MHIFDGSMTVENSFGEPHLLHVNKKPWLKPRLFCAQNGFLTILPLWRGTKGEELIGYSIKMKGWRVICNPQRAKPLLKVNTKKKPLAQRPTVYNFISFVRLTQSKVNRQTTSSTCFTSGCFTWSPSRHAA